MICKKNRRAFLDHWACSFTIYPHHTFLGVITHFFDANAHAESKPQRHLRSIHVPRNPSVGIQASNFGRIKPPSRLRRIHVHGVQASESKLQISAASNLQAGFIVSTSTESMLRNPRFQFRQRRTYCYLHAGFVASTSTESKLPISISLAIDVIAAPSPSCFIHL